MSGVWGNLLGMVVGIVRGTVAFIVTAVLGGVCLVFGFSPDEWIATVITQPPQWLLHPLTRVAGVAAGGLFGFLAWKFWPWRSGRGARNADGQQQEIQLARSWLGLSKEILEFTSESAANEPILDIRSRGTTEEDTQREWERHTSQTLRHHNNIRTRSIQKFAGRIEDARQQIQHRKLIKNNEHRLKFAEINSLTMNEAAKQIAAAARQLLRQHGVDPDDIL